MSGLVQIMTHIKQPTVSRYILGSTGSPAMQSTFGSEEIGCSEACNQTSEISQALHVQGAPIKKQSHKKMHYLSYCYRFFHQIYSFHRGGFRLHTKQTLLKYLLWFKIYSHLNLKVQFSK